MICRANFLQNLIINCVLPTVKLSFQDISPELTAIENFKKN